MKLLQDAAKNKVVIVAGYQEIDGEVSRSTFFAQSLSLTTITS